MTAKKSNFEEKRKHPRFAVDMGSFAVFRKDSSVMPGLIADISLGGLAFYYDANEEWPEDTAELYTLFGENFCIENIPLQSVADFEPPPSGHPVYRYLAQRTPPPRQIRRRGVSFGPLSPEQEEALQGLIAEFKAFLLAQKTG